MCKRGWYASYRFKQKGISCLRHYMDGSWRINQTTRLCFMAPHLKGSYAKMYVYLFLHLNPSFIDGFSKVIPQRIETSYHLGYYFWKFIYKCGARKQRCVIWLICEDAPILKVLLDEVEYDVIFTVLWIVYCYLWLMTFVTSPSKSDDMGVRNLLWKCAICRISLWCRLPL